MIRQEKLHEIHLSKIFVLKMKEIMMSIVTVKMMISKKSKKVYKYNLKIFNYV